MPDLLEPPPEIGGQLTKLSEELVELRVMEIAAKYRIRVEDFIDDPPDQQKVANKVYQIRMKHGVSGSAETDWYVAQMIVLQILDHRKTEPTHELERRAAKFAKLSSKALVEERILFSVMRMTSQTPFYEWSGQLMELRALRACCITAIANLTGENLMELHERFDGETAIPDDKFLAHLRSKGFELTELTREYLCPTGEVILSLIKPRHVVLIKYMTTSDESTWCIGWQGHERHGHEHLETNVAALYGRHILARYLVWHSSWQSDVQVMFNMLQAEDPEMFKTLTPSMARRIAKLSWKEFQDMMEIIKCVHSKPSVDLLLPE